MLNAIPIFYLSFLKLPTRVWKKIVRIQREFLWGGVGAGKKISWVRWKAVCQYKEEGGLGVRDVRILNVSLLAKWKWRLLDGETALWKDVLREIYGNHVTQMLEGVLYPNWRNASRWCKDVIHLENFGVQNWFNVEMNKSIGDGRNSSFWNDRWRGDLTFRNKYPRLFSISNQKEAMVSDIGEVVGSLTEWHFDWRRDFFD